jgi:hypothetical protein
VIAPTLVTPASVALRSAATAFSPLLAAAGLSTLAPAHTDRLERSVQPSPPLVAGPTVSHLEAPSTAAGGAVPAAHRWGRVLAGAALGAAFGAGVGSGTAMVYAAKGLEVGTALHMGIIAGGGAINTVIVGKAFEPKLGKPDAYVMGALVGTGFTWATSALGMLGHPVLGAVAGGTLGALYGGFGALLT